MILRAVFAVVFLVSMFAITPTAFADESVNITWATMAPMPTPRMAPVGAAVNGRLYAIGGRPVTNGTSSGLNVVEEYDPLTNSWATKAPMPTSRGIRGGGVVDAKIYIIGGWDGLSTTYDKNEEYNPVTDSWATKTPLPVTLGGAACGGTVVNGKIYLIGGFSQTEDNEQNTVYEYNPATDTWATKAPMPTARCESGAAVINGKIYIIGGLADGTRLQALEVYDPATDSWETKASMPTARRALSAVSVGGKIYAIGGEPSGVSATVEEYNPTTDTWRTATSLNTGRIALSATKIGSVIYTVGGLRNGTVVGTNERGILVEAPVTGANKYAIIAMAFFALCLGGLLITSRRPAIS